MIRRLSYYTLLLLKNKSILLASSNPCLNVVYVLFVYIIPCHTTKIYIILLAFCAIGKGKCIKLHKDQIRTRRTKTQQTLFSVLNNIILEIVHRVFLY